MKSFNYSFVIFLMTISLSCLSCTKKEVGVYDIPENMGVNNAITKAKMMVYATWTPLHDVPNNAGYYFSGEKIMGLPYSSVKEIDTFIGSEVSIYTFLSAVQNPRSLLYTENLKTKKYNTRNGATYYGVVCNTLVCYAYGLDVLYNSYDFANVEAFTEIPNFDDMMLADMLWSVGHVEMITSIARNKDGKILEIEISAAAGTGTFSYTLSYSNFMGKLREKTYKLYRYKEIKKNIQINTLDMEVTSQGDKYEFNRDLCLDKGDKSCYRVGERVVVNVLKPNNYSEIELYMDGDLYGRYDIVEDLVLDNLPYGKYHVKLINGGSSSEAASFVVVDTKVILKGDELYLSSENSRPLYAEITDIYGLSKQIIILSQDDINNGFVKMNTPLKGTYYVKVHFKTQYGRVINSPIMVVL